MSPLLTAFIFAFGAVIGSFLNAVLWRLHSGESFVRGRSHCPACSHALAVLDLIPILSWLTLGGKCRYCRKGIGMSYLVIELATGALFVLAVRSIAGFGIIDATDLATVLFRWYLIATLVVVFVFDLRHMLILRSVTTPAIILAAVGSLALGMNPFSLLVGMAFGGGFFWLQYFLSKGRWVGGGDIQLGLLMGAILGWPMTMAAIFMAYITGAIYGIAVLAMRRKGWKSEVPFGTFLSASTVAIMLWGEQIVVWYFGLLA